VFVNTAAVAIEMLDHIKILGIAIRDQMFLEMQDFDFAPTAASLAPTALILG